MRANRARDRTTSSKPGATRLQAGQSSQIHGPTIAQRSDLRTSSSAALAKTHNAAIDHTSPEANAATTPHRRATNMGTFQTFRIRTDVEQAKPMRPTTCSTNAYTPQPRVKSRNATRPLGGETADTGHAPTSRLGFQGKDFRPDESHCPQHLTEAAINERLDTLRTKRVDKHPQSINPTTLYGSDSINDPRYQSDWNPERTPDPCPPHPRTAPGSAPPGGREPAGRARRRRLPGSTNTLGRR